MEGEIPAVLSRALGTPLGTVVQVATLGFLILPSA